MSEFNLREAKRDEVSIILEYIKKMAKYEKLSDQVVATEGSLDKWLFEKEIGKVLFIEEDNIIIGFVLYFFNFSTFEGKAGLYLEDIFIEEEYRGKGYGSRIFKELAKIALENDCGRFEWVCLDWNEPSIRFYEKIGAIQMEDWTIHRLYKEGIKKLIEEV